MLYTIKSLAFPHNPLQNIGQQHLEKPLISIIGLSFSSVQVNLVRSQFGLQLINLAI